LLEAFGKLLTTWEHGGMAVVVDDGSTDRTREVIQNWSSKVPVELVVHPVNRGLGETIRDALRKAAAIAQPGDIIVTMDADNTHKVEQIPEMAALIRAGNDLVIASRYRTGSRTVGLSAFRRLTSIGVSILYQVIFPMRGVRDYTTGFRVYRAYLVQTAFALRGDDLVTEKSFACMAEILVKMRKLKPRIVEVPMVLRYDLKEGRSKMQVGLTIIKTLQLMARLRLGD
jgi:dolichol-phosphate mannosyltransferase